MYPSEHERLASLIERSRVSGVPEDICFYVDRLRYVVHCEWDGGVPFLGFTDPNGKHSETSSSHALHLLESADAFSVQVVSV